MSTAHRRRARYHPGDWVAFQFGPDPVRAQVIENRGPLGAGGRPLYRVRLGRLWSEPLEFEVSEDQLQSVDLDSAQVVEYLKQGGLLEVLRKNLSGGSPSPRAWLTFDAQGQLCLTAQAERSVRGGAEIPLAALFGNAVFRPKEGEVVDFLKEGFGLSDAEAAGVVRTIGLAP